MLGFINYFILQWFFVRLTKVAKNAEDRRPLSWGVIFVRPLSGWKGPYKPAKPKYYRLWKTKLGRTSKFDPAVWFHARKHQDMKRVVAWYVGNKRMMVLLMLETFFNLEPDDAQAVYDYLVSLNEEGEVKP